MLRHGCIKTSKFAFRNGVRSLANLMLERGWRDTHAIQIIKQIFSDRMFPLTLHGLDKATRELSR